MSTIGVRRATLPAFTPTSVPAEELAVRTVGRSAIVDRLVGRLRSAATSGDRPHVLVVGPRGSGKTHLLRVVTHMAMGDRRLQRRLAVATLPEDAPEIVTYEDLLFAVVGRVAPSARAATADAMSTARTLRRDATGLESLLVDLLGRRVLVLVIENLDRIFDDMGPTGQARLRAFVETSQRVVLLASTPLLFEAVSSHEEPWYGSFTVENLEDLSVDEGAELLRQIAMASGDKHLAGFLNTPEARTRLQAVAHLTGGSPRMWTVLASCLTVELLDELVPLVRAMLDELVPYYQERLNSLAPNERKLVVEICRSTDVDEQGEVVRSGHGMRTVRELAAICGIDATVAATSLNRLHEARWVRRSKQPGTDQRTTWYEVREPMLRHHLQYRDSDGETLRVIVAFLRVWYSLSERRRQLMEVAPESLAERYLRHLVASEPDTVTIEPFTSGSTEQLLAGARVWIDDANTDDPALIRSRLAGVVAEATVLAVTSDARAAKAAARRRIERSVLSDRDVMRSVVQAAIVAAMPGHDSEDPKDLVAAGLQAACAASGRASPQDQAALMLLYAGWRGAVGRGDEAIEDLKRLRSHTHVLDGDQALRLAVDATLLQLWCDQDDPQALAFGAQLESAQVARLGPTHVDTLETRRKIASELMARDDFFEAQRVFEPLVTDYALVLGVDHPRTQMVRLGSALAAFRCGDYQSVARHSPQLVTTLDQHGYGDDIMAGMAAIVAISLVETNQPEQGLGLLGRVYSESVAVAASDSRGYLRTALVAVTRRLPLDTIRQILTNPASELTQPIHDALELDPEGILCTWVAATTALPASRSSEVARAVAAAPADRDFARSLSVAILYSLMMTADQEIPHRAAWLESWISALDEVARPGLETQMLTEVAAALRGDRTALLRMPAELRRIAEKLVRGEPVQGGEGAHSP